MTLSPNSQPDTSLSSTSPCYDTKYWHHNTHDVIPGEENQYCKLCNWSMLVGVYIVVVGVAGRHLDVQLSYLDVACRRHSIALDSSISAMMK